MAASAPSPHISEPANGNRMAARTAGMDGGAETSLAIRGSIVSSESFQRAMYSRRSLFCEARAAVSNVRICNLLMAPRSVFSN